MASLRIEYVSAADLATFKTELDSLYQSITSPDTIAKIDYLYDGTNYVAIITVAQQQ